MQLAARRSVRRTPIGPQRWVGAVAVLLEPTDTGLPIVAQPCAQRRGWRSGGEAEGRRATAPPLTGRAVQRQGEGRLRSTALGPEAQPWREAPGPLRPHQQDAGETRHGRALLTGIPPDQARDRRRNGRGKPRVIREPIASLPRRTMGAPRVLGVWAPTTRLATSSSNGPVTPWARPRPAPHHWSTCHNRARR